MFLFHFVCPSDGGFVAKCLKDNGLSRDLQDQENETLRSTFAVSKFQETAQNPSRGSSLHVKDQNCTYFGKRRFEHESRNPQLGLGEKYLNATLGQQTPHDSGEFGQHLVDLIPDTAGQLKKHVVDEENKLNWCSLSIMHSGPSLNMCEPRMEPHTSKDKEMQCATSWNLKSTFLRQSDYVQGMEVDYQPGQRILSQGCAGNSPIATEKLHPLSLQLHEEVKSNGDSSCKLFGISLISNPFPMEPAMPHEMFMLRPQGQFNHASDHLQDMGSNLSLQELKNPKCSESIIRCDEEKSFLASDNFVLNKTQGGLTRRCVKVFTTPWLIE